MVSEREAVGVLLFACPVFVTVNRVSALVPSRAVEKLLADGETESMAGEASKVAVTMLVAMPRLSTQLPVPVHAPDQPPNVCVPSAAAVSVTGADVKVAVHVEPHEMPAGDDITVPPPALVTVTCAVAVPCIDADALPPGEADTDSDTPVLAPTDAGVNFTPIVHIALAANADGQVFDDTAKFVVSDRLGAPSVPVDDWPVFISVNSTSLLVPPTASMPKSCDPGIIDSAPAVSAVPVRDDVGLPPCDALTVSVAGFEPDMPVGLNCTVTVQVAPAASCAPMHVPPVTE
jgi:hypothetical protein